MTRFIHGNQHLQYPKNKQETPRYSETAKQREIKLISRKV